MGAFGCAAGHGDCAGARRGNAPSRILRRGRGYDLERRCPPGAPITGQPSEGTIMNSASWTISVIAILIVAAIAANEFRKRN